MDTCAVLTVVPCYRSKCFVPAPPMEVRADGTRLTSFRASLAKFAGCGAVEPGTPTWNGAVAKALATARAAISSGGGQSSGGSMSLTTDDSLYGTDPNTARLSQRMSVGEFNELAAAAGIAVRAE